MMMTGRSGENIIRETSFDIFFFINRKNRGSKVSKNAELLLNKFIQQVEQIFNNLPKSLEWRSFYSNDLLLLVDFCEEVQEISIRHCLNTSQTRALAKLRQASAKEFHLAKGQNQTAPRPLNNFSI